MGFLRKFLAWLMVPVLCLVGLVICLVRPFNPDNTRIIGRMLAVVGRWVLGMERPLSGRDNLPWDRRTIIIANHQHNEDLFVFADLVPPRTVTVGKSALIWAPVFGQVYWLAGNVLINRARSHKAVAVMQATSDAVTRENKGLWIFPEGTRSHGQELGRFKKGAFHAAITSGAPITMICAGVYRSKCNGPAGRHEPVAVRILPPVETKDLSIADVPRLMEQCRRQMEQTIAALSFG